MPYDENVKNSQPLLPWFMDPTNKGNLRLLIELALIPVGDDKPGGVFTRADLIAEARRYGPDIPFTDEAMDEVIDGWDPAELISLGDGRYTCPWASRP